MAKLPSSTTLIRGAIVAALLVFALLRVIHLEADPPRNLSGSSDVYTDPPQYTYFAKNLVKFGEFNPLEDDRRVFFLKSTVTAVSVAVFAVLGVGLWQSSLVGLLFSFGSLILFGLAVRRIAGTRAALFFILLIGLNFNQLFYGRLPFLEHAMTFFASGAFLLTVTYHKTWSYLTAGALLAIGVFFGKVVGIVFAFPFACLLAYQFLFELREAPAVKRWLSPASFLAGFGLVTVVWLLVSYLPAQSQVGGYIQEQAVDLYGAPEGLQSFDDFVWKMVSFGVKSNLFPRMSLVAMFGCAMVGMVLYHVGKKDSWKNGFGSLNSGHVFLATMIIAFFGSLMIWNYRPLRYELVLILPFCAAAAIVMDRLASEWREPSGDRKTPLLFYLLFWPVAMTAMTQLYSATVRELGGKFAFDPNKWLLAATSLIFTLLVGGLVSAYRAGTIPRLPWIGKIVVVVALAGVVGRGAYDYSVWLQSPTYSIRDNSLDMSMILPRDAIVSGPFGPQFTVENEVGTLIHMFGVAQVDTALFGRFPVTHLLVDEANENRARDDYPFVMGKAKHVVTYYVGKKKVRLYRIAEATGNPANRNYRRSEFEVAVDLYQADSKVEANRLLIEFLKLHPTNMSGLLMMYELAKGAEQYPQAEVLLKKAVEFSPTNYNLNGTLAVFYKERFEETRNPKYKSLALQYFDIAQELAPTVKKLKTQRTELEELDIAP